MIQRLLNTMKLQANLSGARGTFRIGLVSSYDPNNYSAKVMFQPENIESGWLPISTEWVGNGWGLFMPPSMNDMVMVEFLEGDFEAGIITKRLYNDSDRPLSVQGGEFWLVHKSGSLMKFHNDGSMELTANTNLTATVGGNLTANVTGNAVIKAATIALQNAGTALQTLLNSTLLTWLNGHVHGNGNGGANTTGPTTQPAASVSTSIVKAE